MYEHTYCMQPSAILLDNFLFLRKKQVHVLVLMEIIKKKLKNVYIDFFFKSGLCKKNYNAVKCIFFPNKCFSDILYIWIYAIVLTKKTFFVDEHKL